MNYKKTSKESEAMAGEQQLHLFGAFLDRYQHNIGTVRNGLRPLAQRKENVITVELASTENNHLLSLNLSDNRLFAKSLLSLTTLCTEVKRLQMHAQTNLLPILLLYDVSSKNSANAMHKVAKTLKHLLSAVSLIKRLQLLITQLLEQLCALIAHETAIGTHLCFREPILCLADLLALLHTLDCIFAQSCIQQDVAEYRKFIKTTCLGRSQKQFDSGKALDGRIREMQAELFTKMIISRSLENAVDEVLMIKIRKTSLSDELALFTCYLIDCVTDRDNILPYRTNIVQVNMLCILQHHLTGSMNKKYYRKLTQLNKKLYRPSIFATVLWDPEALFSKYLPANNRKPSDIASSKDTAVRKVQNIPKESRILSIKVCKWLMDFKMAMVMSPQSLRVRHLQAIEEIISEGRALITLVAETVLSVANFHVATETPIRISLVIPFMHLVEALKAVHSVVQRKRLPFGYVLRMIEQHVKYKLFTCLIAVQKTLKREKSYNTQQLNVLTKIASIEQCLKGPNTCNRLLIARLAVSATDFTSENLAEIRKHLNNLETISEVDAMLQQLNLSFMYWHKIFFSLFYKKLLNCNVDFSRLSLSVLALTDSFSVLQKSNVVENAEDMANMNVEESTEKSATQILLIHLLKPLMVRLENCLRLQTHDNKGSSTPNKVLNDSLEQYSTSSQLQTIECLTLLPFCDCYVDVQASIQNEFNNMFYNYTAMALHDWRTYGEMRRLAEVQYGLKTVEDHLPMHTLEQGIDMLEIMRNIDVFVAKYQYNINDQLFVQKQSNNKHLSSVNIMHVANSIRTHGIGVTNTAVNYTYQFLQKQFYIFSQFLFDEYIKSKLLREIRFYAEHRSKTHEIYPYERAEQFNLSIRKLGLQQGTGQSYLDLFRELISQIGNALGYIRLIRSGQRRCIADSTCFLPDLKCTHLLPDYLHRSLLSEVSRESADILNEFIDSLRANYAESTEYFQLLLNVFRAVLCSKSNGHLNNFYMIIPPLTINYVDNLLTCKEHLNKRNKELAAFTDDGFAIGLSFIISLLQQLEKFQSLRWFQSIKVKLENEKQVVQHQMRSSGKDDVKLLQTLTLTEKRLKALETEFQLLFYSISNANIFFQ